MSMYVGSRGVVDRVGETHEAEARSRTRVRGAPRLGVLVKRVPLGILHHRALVERPLLDYLELREYSVWPAPSP